MISVQLPDGSIKEFPEGSRARDVAESIGKRLAEAAVAATANGKIVDLDLPLEPATPGAPIPFSILTPKNREALDVLRHSSAHVMARAIMRLFPGVQLAFGPTTGTGFYYDVTLPGRSLSEEDFPAIEAEMTRIVVEAEPFERFQLPTEEARQFCLDLGQTLKVEHIDEELSQEKYGPTLSFYRLGEFVDLCRGPHIPHTGKIGAFKLTSIAGAYWKGRTDGPVLQRVYGTAFFERKELDAYLHQIEEAKKRDHRRIGKELGLFAISPLVGSGLILWLPKGAIVRGVLEQFLKDELIKRGYQPVYTPHIGKVDLYKCSGHYPYYKDSQFPPLKLLSDAATQLVLELEKAQPDELVERELLKKTGIDTRGFWDRDAAGRQEYIEANAFSESARAVFYSAEVTQREKVEADLERLGIDPKGYFERREKHRRIKFVEVFDHSEEYLLKPMNCPHHIQIYAAEPRSYRDLPLRLAEFGTVYRYEQSGELSGLTRVRGFTQDDAHLFCTPDQVRAEFRATMELTQFVLESLGLGDYRTRLSKHDPEDPKYQGAAGDTWRQAEADIRAVLDEMGLPYDEAPGEAAFYGPKADFLVRDCLGRQWQLGTVQLDYVLPQRFDLKYVTAENKTETPVMIHRAPFGSMERFMGILIEHFAGAFPLWLAPEQVRVLPISEKVTDYAHSVLNTLQSAGLRASIDERPEKIGARIRDAQLEKIPVMLVVGQKEAESGLVAYRDRTAGDQGAMPLADALTRLRQEIETRTSHAAPPAPAPAAEPGADAGSERFEY